MEPIIEKTIITTPHLIESEVARAVWELNKDLPDERGKCYVIKSKTQRKLPDNTIQLKIIFTL